MSEKQAGLEFYRVWHFLNAVFGMQFLECVLWYEVWGVVLRVECSWVAFAVLTVPSAGHSWFFLEIIYEH